MEDNQARADATTTAKAGESAPPTGAAPSEGLGGAMRGKLRGVGYEDGAAMVRLGTGTSGDEPPILSGLKAKFGALLGVDLGGIQVHVGSAGPAAAGARGHASGREIHLGIEVSALTSRDGQLLLAHELVHVAQVGLGLAPAAEETREDEADAMAERLVEGSAASARASASSATTHQKKVGLLSGSEEQEAIAYNKDQGFSKATVKRYQEIVGTTADGLFGPKTAEAVARFQAAHGLSADGMIGPHTRATLAGVGSEPPQTSTPPPTTKPPAGSATLNAAQVQAAVEWYQVRSPMYPASVIKQIQGAVGVEVDGTAGPLTVKAIASWQASHGLYKDGMAGDKTLVAMFGSDIRPESSSDETAAPPGSMALTRPSGLSQIIAVFGKHGKNITSAAMRAGAGGAVINVPCNAGVAPLLKAVFDDIHAAGLSDHIHSYDGCYVNRTKRKNSSSWSTHAWGIAIDINASANPMVGSKKMGSMKVSDSQKKLAPFFEAHGFYWGKAFGDPMHFQYCTGY